MKKSVIRYGIYATALLVVFGLINLFLVSKFANYGIQEVAGYLTIFLAVLFIYPGIRHFRDHQNGGYLSFGEGLKIGVLILLFPSIAFGVLDILYTEVLNPSWKQEYFDHYLEQLKTSVPADQFETERKKLEAQRELFANPLIQFLLMSVTVFIIGLMVTIISALTLRRSKQVSVA